MGEEEQKVVQVVQSGEQIVIPEGMDENTAIKWLQRRRDEREQVVTFSSVLDGYPLDAALALATALQRKYGYMSLVTTPGFLRDTPPHFFDISVGPNGETRQAPFGRIEIPGIEGYFATSIDQKDGRYVLSLTGKTKQKHKAAFVAVADLARQVLREESVYKGKAFRVKFAEPDEDGRLPDFNWTDGPRFLDLSGVRPDELVFSREIDQKLKVNLFGPVENTELLRKLQIPRKRGILLGGPYGVGKTMAAYVAALKCVEHKWTFIYLEQAQDLPQALLFAQQYQPAMVFAEDIDRTMTPGDEEEENEIYKVLNRVDGVDTKNAEVMVVFTTNHVEHIHKAMLRPGRLDCTVIVDPPDQESVERLVRLYARGLVAPDEHLAGVGAALAGQIPAVIKEVVERAKLTALCRAGSDAFRITSADLLASIDHAHILLMAEQERDDRSDLERAADTLGRHVAGALKPDLLHSGNGALAPTVAESETAKAKSGKALPTRS